MTTWRDGWLEWMLAVKQRGSTALLPCLLLISVSVGVQAASVTPSTAFVEDAWRFACAITNDANDRTLCQAKVARAWLEAGEPQRAIEYAAKIADWRKLAITADAASWWAGRGRTNEATRALLEAEYLAPGVKDWPFDRVQMHLAHTKALLGRKSELMVLEATYRDNRDYSGAIQAALALEAARRGAVDEAVAALGRISSQQHLDLMSARAAGLRDVAVCEKISAEQASLLLQQAWKAACAVPGWRKVDLQLELVDTLRGTRLETNARDYLRDVTSAVQSEPYPDRIRAERLAGAALRWGWLGDSAQVTKLGGQSMTLMRSSMELIEQPALLAKMGEAYAAAGDAARSAEYFGDALAVAAALANPRPKAIAAVDVMLAMARAGLDEKQFEEKRHALLAGFEGRGR